MMRLPILYRRKAVAELILRMLWLGRLSRCYVLWARVEKVVWVSTVLRGLILRMVVWIAR